MGEVIGERRVGQPGSLQVLSQPSHGPGVGALGVGCNGGSRELCGRGGGSESGAGGGGQCGDRNALRNACVCHGLCSYLFISVNYTQPIQDFSNPYVKFPGVSVRHRGAQ